MPIHGCYSCTMGKSSHPASMTSNLSQHNEKKRKKLQLMIYHESREQYIRQSETVKDFSVGLKVTNYSIKGRPLRISLQANHNWFNNAGRATHRRCVSPWVFAKQREGETWYIGALTEPDVTSSLLPFTSKAISCLQDFEDSGSQNLQRTNTLSHYSFFHDFDAKQLSIGPWWMFLIK